MSAPRQKMPGVPISRAFAFFALAVALLAPVAARADQTWLVVSDIHLLPYDTQQAPTPPGRDSNLALLDSALAEMKHSIPAPAVVLIPGDFLAHNFPRLVGLHDAGTAPSGAGLQVMKLIARRFAQVYPKAQFAIVLGNNDDPCGDYHSPVDGSYLREVAKIWAPLVNRAGAAPDFERAFSQGAYYTASLPVHGLRLIALNTVYFSKEYLGDCKGRRPEAQPRELAWLRATIASTPAGTRNVLMMHIPPGFDAFVTEMARGVIGWPYYNGDANDALLSIVAGAPDRIAFGVAGHAHRFDFRLIPAKTPVPFFVFGALSPVYGNNPNFSAVTVTPGGAVRDIVFHVFDETTGVWEPGRSFNAEWKTEAASIEAPVLAGLHRDLGVKPAMRTAWDAQSSAWPARGASARVLWAAGWRIAWCAQVDQSASFPTCAQIGDPMSWLRAIAVIVPAIVLAIVLVVILRRRRRS
jgi:Calcineurin-like phosphoesterase